MTLRDTLAGLKDRLKGVEGLADDVFSTFDSAIATAESYTGIDPQKARDALSQLGQRQAIDQRLESLGTEKEQLSGTVADMKMQLLNTQKELTAVRALTQAGVREGYEDLLLPRIANSLEVGEDGAVTLPDGLIASFKEKYGDMFHALDAAGTGSQVAGGAVPVSGPRQVSVGSDRMITGLDPAAVLSGDVVLKDQ